MADFPINQILSSLNSASIQQKQPALYQAIKTLIDASRNVQVTANAAITIAESTTGGTPGGANTSIQFNDGGEFNGFGTWDGVTLTIPGDVIDFANGEFVYGGGAFNITNSTGASFGVTSTGATGGAAFQINTFLDSNTDNATATLAVHADEVNAAAFAFVLKGDSGNNTPDTLFAFPGDASFDLVDGFKVSIDRAASVLAGTAFAVGNNYTQNQNYAGFPSKAVFASDGATVWQTAYVDTTAGVDYAGVISAYPESGVGVFELAGGLNGEAGFHIYPSDYPAANDARIEFFGANVEITGKTFTPGSFTFATLPATPTVGMEVVITDSNTNVWGANIAGGGANNVSARYNGANWTVTGK